MKKFTRVEPTINQQVGRRFKRAVVVKSFQTDDGLTHEFTTWNKEGSRGAAMLALTKDKKVITCYQFRGGPERWMYEIPGGSLEDGEDPQEGALRELLEESGYVPGAVEFLGSSYGDPYTNFERYYYLATDCVPASTAHQPDAEEAEQGAEVHLLSIDEFIEKAKRDEMTDLAAVLMAYDKLKGLAK